MPFLLMVFLTLVCMPRVDGWSQPGWDPSFWESALWTWLGVFLTVAYAFIISRPLCRPLNQSVARREAMLQRYDRRRAFHSILLLVTYGLSIWLFGWGWAVKQFWRWHGATLLPAADLLVLAPFLTALILSWAFFYDADRASYQAVHRLLTIDLVSTLDPGGAAVVQPQPFGSRLGYIWFQLRQKLALVFLPVTLLLLQKEIDLRFSGVLADWPWLLQGVGIVMVIAMFVSIPWIVKLVLGLKPLPPGPLRDRLLATARRHRFRCTDLLYWNTRGGMANALVVGIVPWLRYVVFTDRLLEEFTPEEVEAVLGHEMGHIKHRHMLYYVVFLAASMVVMWVVVTQALPQLLDWLAPNAQLADRFLFLGKQQYDQALPVLLFLLVYIFVVFGFLSRRCERQADVCGCRVVSCGQPKCEGHEPGVPLPGAANGLCPTGIRIFIQALEKVAVINGINRERAGFLQWWQHGTIARRVQFLETMLADPIVEPTFQRRVAMVKWGLFAALAAVFTLTIWLTGLINVTP
jgi:Zn-dependent protease with chaperone function